MLSDTAMTYEFDPELAAALPFLPMVGGSGDGDDLAGARSKQLEFANAMNANVDTTGLSVEDVLVPSPDNPVPVRILSPGWRRSASGRAPPAWRRLHLRKHRDGTRHVGADRR